MRVNDRLFYHFKTALLLLWGLALLLALLIIGPQRILDSYGSLTPESIHDFIYSFGLLSVTIYILFHAVRSFFFLPVTPLSIAGGFVFGAIVGLPLTILGRAISALITFGISRYLFRDYIKARIRDRYEGWEQRLEKGGLYYVALMRMIPLLPFDVVGYVSGVSSVSLKKYLAGSLIGDLPGVVVLTLLGSSLNEPGSPLFYASLLVAAVALAVSALYIKLYHGKITARAAK